MCPNVNYTISELHKNYELLLFIFKLSYNT